MKNNMKCVCGYEYFANKSKQKVGYKRIDTRVLIKTNLIINNKTVFICPNCGTLKVDIE